MENISTAVDQGIFTTIVECTAEWITVTDNFRMNTGYGRYGATYNMVGLSCFNDELPCV
jgi:hypothetical protein